MTLVEPTRSGYVMLALEIDRRPPFAYFIESPDKRRACRLMGSLAQQLCLREDVVEATAFKALIIPPGRGKLLKERPHVHKVRFDLVLLVETRTPEAARALVRHADWAARARELMGLSRVGMCITAQNARRIGAVDHRQNGIFLLNYFYADQLEQNLQVWEYTAGWFQQETGLDNSVLLLPDADQTLDYKIINHAGWPRLGDILPALLFKPSFRSFVLANFAANGTAAMPILYRTF